MLGLWRSRCGHTIGWAPSLAALCTMPAAMVVAAAAAVVGVGAATIAAAAATTATAATAAAADVCASCFKHLQLLLLQGWLVAPGVGVCQQVVLIRQDQRLGPHRPVARLAAAVAAGAATLLQPARSSLHAVLTLLLLLLLLAACSSGALALPGLAACAVRIHGPHRAVGLLLQVPRPRHASVLLMLLIWKADGRVLGVLSQWGTAPL